MEKQFTQEQKYILARKRVEKITKFYKHLAVYIIVNTFLTAVNIFGLGMFFSNNWEERKIKEYMNQQDNGR